MFIGFQACIIALYSDGTIHVRRDPDERQPDRRLDLVDVDLYIRGLSQRHLEVGRKVEITVKLKE